MLEFGDENTVRDSSYGPSEWKLDFRVYLCIYIHLIHSIWMLQTLLKLNCTDADGMAVRTQISSS
jgi:hypothetical protein